MAAFADSVRRHGVRWRIVITLFRNSPRRTKKIWSIAFICLDSLIDRPMKKCSDRFIPSSIQNTIPHRDKASAFHFNTYQKSFGLSFILSKFLVICLALHAILKNISLVPRRSALSWEDTGQSPREVHEFWGQAIIFYQTSFSCQVRALLLRV